MTIILSAAVVVFGALVFLLLGSQVEMYRSIAQLRELSGLIDRPNTIDLAGAVGGRPSAFGLPKQLDEATGAVVLFLSDKCGTCRSIAAALHGDMPEGLWLVLDPANPVAEAELSLTYDFDLDRVLVDGDHTVAEALNVAVTPAAVVIRDGRVTRGTTIPSSRQLFTLLENIQPAGPTDIQLEAMIAGKDQA
ncbi:hypothetical protein [Nonomuraea sp. NPDC048916]|uniref:hypothetical protein n=1 Tax=Nonomuraea sp. NPDC048916 TaxID=3154232 RepID=UPI0033D8B109